MNVLFRCIVARGAGVKLCDSDVTFGARTFKLGLVTFRTRSPLWRFLLSRLSSSGTLSPLFSSRASDGMGSPPPPQRTRGREPDESEQDCGGGRKEAMQCFISESSTYMTPKKREKEVKMSDRVVGVLTGILTTSLCFALPEDGQ